MKTKLSPKQRLEIYEMMVPMFELDAIHSIILKVGFCKATDILGVELEDLIELKEPKGNAGWWWYPVVWFDERDDKRCEVLYKAIEDVLTKIK